MLGISIESKSAQEVAQECINQGLIILTAKDKIRLLPPLNITMNELEKGINILANILEK